VHIFEGRVRLVWAAGCRSPILSSGLSTSLLFLSAGLPSGMSRECVPSGLSGGNDAQVIPIGRRHSQYRRFGERREPGRRAVCSLV